MDNIPTSRFCVQKSDAELVKLTLKDQDFFGCLVEKYQQCLLRYILRITNIDFEEAQDILQEVFIKVYTHLNDFDSRLSFSSWIYRITHNFVISHFRKTQARPQVLVNDEENNILNNIAADLDVHREVDQKILAVKVKGILAKLERKYRAVIILKYFEEKTYEEMSDILRKPAGTIATLLNRGKKKFYEEFQKIYEH